MEQKVFICYESTTGKSYSEHLKKALEKVKNIKYNVFLADITLCGGDEWRKKINNALENCNIFIVIITALTMDSVEVDKEFNIAVRLNKKIVPFRYSGIDVEETNEISRLQQITFTDKFDLANKAILELKEIIQIQTNNMMEESDEFLRRGNLYFNLKMYDEALTFYINAIKIVENSPQVWANISKIYSIKNQYLEAFNSINQAIDLNPNFDDAWIDKGFLYYDLNNFDDALLSFDNAIKINSNSIDAWRAKGALLDKLKRFNEAIISINIVLNFAPDDYQTWVLRGYTNFKMKQFDDAESDYNTAISIKPDFADAWYNMASLYSNKKDKEKAIKYLKKAINFNNEFRNSFIEDDDFDNFITLEDIK